MKKSGILARAFVAVAFVAIMLGGSFANALDACVGEGNKYPNLAIDNPGDGYVYCQRVKVNEEYHNIYAKSSHDCAQAGALATNPDTCNDGDLNDMIRMIITTVIFAVGMVAVIMIIIGGVNYATSQGDAAKVKKGKDTILYGIIGLVIAILAFAIVSFVLSALQS